MASGVIIESCTKWLQRKCGPGILVSLGCPDFPVGVKKSSEWTRVKEGGESRRGENRQRFSGGASLSRQALVSELVRSGLRDVLLDHVGLYEALRGEGWYQTAVA